MASASISSMFGLASRPGVWAAVFLVTQAGPLVGRQSPAASLDQVVERAARYVAGYGTEFSLVVGVEHYTQSVRYVDAVEVRTTSERPWTRNTTSEFALVRVKDDWIGFRDVVEVDGKQVGDRRDRLQQLFLQSPGTAFEQGRRIADESARYNAGTVQRNFNVPTMALVFLQPTNVQRFKFKKAGTDTIDGTPVWKVRYEETRKPTIIRTSSGKDVPVTGMFWIEPNEGRVLKTFMEITQEAPLSTAGQERDPRMMAPSDRQVLQDRALDTYSRVTTSYRSDPRLGMLVPAEMVEDHQGLLSLSQATRERIVRVACRAVYSDFKRFETAARLVIPK